MKIISRLFLFLLIACGMPLYAQEVFSKGPGQITQYEATMTSYDQDPDAEAVVIFAESNTSFRPDPSTNQMEAHIQHYIKIKILKQAGISYGEYNIPYYEERDRAENIWGLEGITYNYENGALNRSVLEAKNIFTEKINNNWRRKVFALPNVKEGSIIEIKYTIITPFLFNLREWGFQKKIPVIESLFHLKAVPFYEYAYIVKGTKRFDISTNEVIANEIRWGNWTYREGLYTFGMKNLPAFKDETFITSTNDYMVNMSLQLSKVHYPDGRRSQDIMSTWPAISTAFLKEDNFGKYIKDAVKEGKKIIPELNLTDKTTDDKIKAIIDYVKFTYRWNGEYRRYTTAKLSNFLKEKTGGSADMNLFALGLLNAAGIDAKPVLLSTRGNGLIDEQYPFEKFFNYEIIQVRDGDKTCYFDATERLLKYDELPDRCINIRGLVLDQKSPEWVNILQNDVALTEKKFEIRCNEDLSKLNSTVTFTAYDFDAFSYRNQYSGEESNLKELLQKRNIIPAGNISIENSLDLEKPFVFTFQAETPLSSVPDKLFIAPFLNQSLTENIFKQTTRSLPIDLIHRHAAKYHTVIYIPDGYEVEYLPKQVDHNGKIKLQYEAKEKDGMIEVNASYQFKQSIYEAKDYMALKVTFDDMIKIFNEMIVLKKKSV